MSKENIVKFLDFATKNTDIQDQIIEADKVYAEKVQKKTEDLTMDEVVAAVAAVIVPIAKQNSFDFTAEEFTDFERKLSLGELDDDELAMVAGGCIYIPREDDRWAPWQNYPENDQCILFGGDAINPFDPIIA